jgi:hypothetical protein
MNCKEMRKTLRGQHLRHETIKEKTKSCSQQSLWWLRDLNQMEKRKRANVTLPLN